MSSGACRALVATLLTLVATVGLAVPVSAQQEALRTTAFTEYKVRPNEGSIKVKVTLTFQNRSDSALRGQTWGPVYLEDSATPSFSRGASRAGGFQNLPGPWKAMEIELPDIPANERIKVDIEYDLRGEARENTFPVRVGSGFIFACLTGQDTVRGELRVSLGSGFETTVSGSEMKETASGLSTGLVTNPVSLFTCVEGTNSNRLVESSFVGPSGRQITLQAYPEDSDWLRTAEIKTGEALDKIHTFLGHDIPGNDAVLVRQTPPQSLGGYASDHGTPGIVQVDENAGTPPADIEHEAAHAWFTTDNYPERWMREGMASWVASSLDRRVCDPVGKSSDVSDLSEWQVVRPTAPDNIEKLIRAQDDAACGIVSAVAEKMDDETFKAVIGSMLNSEAKYAGSGTPGIARTDVVDFREWLDAVDERGLVPSGVEDLDFAQDLIAKYGISTNVAELEARSITRERYHDFLDTAAPMAAPQAVRQAMDDWLFPEANRLLDQGEEIITALTSADELLPSAGLLTIIQDDFESARSSSDLDLVFDTASNLLGEAEQIVVPLSELTAASPPGWLPPAAVRSAITERRFDDVIDAIKPALQIAQDTVAADAALPEAGLLDDIQARYEATATEKALQDLAQEISATRRQAEATSIEYATLQSLVGDWVIPAAVTDPIAAGQIAAALAISQDARGVIAAARAADQSLPEAEIGATVRPRFEAVETGAEMAALRADAEKTAGEAIAVGDALASLLGTIGDDWTLPAIVTEPIAERDFATAAKTAVAAQRWIEFADEADVALSEIEALKTIREEFQNASSLDELEAGAQLADDWRQAAIRVAAAKVAAEAPRDLLTRIGLFGTDVTPGLEAAIKAARNGDVALATSEAVVVIDTISSASSGGGLRITGIVFLGIAILGVLGLLLVFRRESGPAWAKHGTPPWAKNK